MKYVMIGGGIAGVSAAETIRANSSEAEICILEAGEERPYLRPLLSKTDIKYLSAEHIALHPAEWYERKQIVLKTSCPVTGIDAANHFVTCQDGSQIRYDRLIFAGGASPAVPPIPGADLNGVHTVRSITDMKKIHRDMAFAENAVVIGGGVIGVELAEELKTAGLNVAVLELTPKLLGRFLDEESAEVFKTRLEAHGIHSFTSVSNIVIEAGGDGLVNTVKAEISGESCAFAADLVILSCGIRANVKLLQEAGAECGRGVIVNNGMETSLPDVLAAGDCIQWDPNPGLWNFSVQSGIIAGLSAVYGAESEEVRNAGLYNGGELIFSGRNMFVYSFGDITGEGIQTTFAQDNRIRYQVNPVVSDEPYEKRFYRDGTLCGAVLIDAHQNLAEIRNTLCGQMGMTPGASEKQLPRSVYLLAADFFADREKAMQILRLLPEWSAHSEEEWQLEYDFLFRGCDADFKPSLWASVCFDERVLCNQTTLEVIKRYYADGCRPVRMEGNPPDYIGEQYRYLYYLTCAGLKKHIEAFTDDYTLENQKLLLKELKKRGTFNAFISVCDHLLHVLGERSDASLASFAKALGIENRTAELWEILKPSAEEFSEIAEDGASPAITPEEPRVILSGGGNNCGGKCVIRPTVQEGCILKIESDLSSNDPQIRACVRGRGYRKTFLSPDRLQYPMKRIGERGSGKFRRITWKQAADEIAEQWIRIRDTYGPGCRYVNYATGITGVMRPSRLAKRLLAADGGYLESYGSYSSACASYITPYIFGDAYFGNSPADVLNAGLVIFWGDNSTETIFGSERNYYLSKLKEKNIRIIAIDPRLSQTAITYADEWIPIRPTSDAALADAMAYTIFAENLQDQAYMDRYCIGFDEDHMPEGVGTNESYHSYLFGLQDGIERTPEWAEPLTGIPADTIRRLAREFAAAKPACIISGYGIQRTGNGEQAVKGIATLAAMTGNIGIPGGNAGGCGMTREHSGPSLAMPPIANPYKGAISIFLWTKAIEHGAEMTARNDRVHGMDKLDANVRMILNLAGNTLINQHSNIADTIRILKDDSKCQLIVCSDIFMTPSARYGDYVLPGTSVFETDNFNAPWRGNNYLLRNNKVIEPLFGTLFEWEWLKDISKNLGLYETFTAGHPEADYWLRKTYEALRKKEHELPDYNTFSALGGWQYKEPKIYIAFEKQIRDPEHHPFKTPSGKIEIFSKTLYDMHLEDVPAVTRYISCPEGPDDPLQKKFPLQLIGWHTRRRTHSMHDNNEWQDEVEKPGLWIHPEDAAARGIANGDDVRIWNDRGTVIIPAVVTTRIMRGVVAMSQGGWYTPDENGADRRGSINVLTSSAYPTPLAKGNPQHTNLVEVAKA
ncbi:MAG: molybdopterin-dependent oxidoreductase [Solobacterium sp.]|nr:molybdopterin-dependent oxidoreductase [Solobacterium sp.]